MLATEGPAALRPAADELESNLIQMHALQMVALWHFLGCVRSLDESRSWRADGCRSTADYLVARFGLAFATAQRYVRLARRLAELPALDAAMSEGRLSLDVAEAVARFATPATDATLTDQALGWTAAEARAAARTAKPVTSGDDADAELSASFRSWLDDETGMVKFSGALPADQGAALLAAIDREEASVPTDPATGVFLPIATRRAQALANLVTARLAADADRATVVVYTTHHDLHAAEGQGELADLAVGLSKAKLDLYTCDCVHQSVVVDERGIPIGVGRRTKNVPRWLRRLVSRRDKGFCQFPGCDSRRFLDCHHLVHWSRGGRTDLDNLALLCRFHHRWLHQSGWNLQRPAGAGAALELVNPRGDVYEPAERGLAPAVRRRVFGPPPPPPFTIAAGSG